MASRALWTLGYPDQALKKSYEALALAEELQHPLSIGFALTLVAVAHQLRREGLAAQAQADAAIIQCRKHGFSFYLASETIWRGWALAVQGQTAEGIAELQRGLAAWRATGAEIAVSHYLAALTDAYQTAAESVQALSEGLRAVAKSGEHFYAAELHRLKGELLLQKTAKGQEVETREEKQEPAALTPVPRPQVPQAADRQSPAANLRPLTPDTQPPAPSGQYFSLFRYEGDHWTLSFAGETCRLDDARGLHCLAQLLRHPGENIHVLTFDSTKISALAPEPSPETLSAQAGPQFDASSRGAYRQRLDELREELEEAEEFNDTGRVERLRDELEALAQNLTTAIGAGERAAAQASLEQRARINVTRAIKTALRKITEHHPALGQHLSTTIRTGVYCSYMPDARVPIVWQE